MLGLFLFAFYRVTPDLQQLLSYSRFKSGTKLNDAAGLLI